MAARSDAATDRVSRATAPALTSFTVMGWVKVVNSVSPFFHEIVRFSDAGASSNLILGMTGAGGLTPRAYSSGSTSGVVSATAYSLGQWVFVCSSHNGTVAVLYHGATPGSLTKVTGSVTVGTPNQLTLFSRSATDGSEWLDGSLAHVRMYTAVLSDAEVVAESQSATAVRTSGLWAAYEDVLSLSDTSGNSRGLTAGTTALSADTDPPLGHTTALGSATETDSASSITRKKSLALGRAAETDSASALVRRKSTALQRATELDTGATLGRAKAAQLGRAAEVDSVAALVRSKALTAGRATETNSAGALARSKATALGRAQEANTATSLVRLKTLGLGRGVETDTAAGVRHGTTITLGRAVETSSAAALVRSRVLQLDRAVEVDTCHFATAAVHVAAEPRLTIQPNGAVLTVRENLATITIDSGGDA